MANPLDTLLQKVRSNVTNTASRLFGQAQSFVQQNPTPAGFIGSRVQQPIQNTFNTLGNQFNTGAQNFLKPSIVSPLPDTKLQKTLDIGRNIIGQTGKQIIQEVPKIGASALRASPSIQLDQQIQGLNPSLQKSITNTRISDAYNLLKGYGLATSGLIGNAVGGLAGMGMNTVNNALQGKPLSQNYAESFGKGVVDNAAFGPINKLAGGVVSQVGKLPIKPVQRAMNIIKSLEEPIVKYGGMYPEQTSLQIAKRALGAGVKGSIEGVIYGSSRPLQNGETRQEAIKNDVLTFTAMSMITQGGKDITRERLKPLAQKIGIGFKDYWNYLKGDGWTELPNGKLRFDESLLASSTKLPEGKVDVTKGRLSDVKPDAFHQTNKLAAQNIEKQGFLTGAETGLREKRGEIYAFPANDNAMKKGVYGDTEIPLYTKGLNIEDRTKINYTDEQLAKKVHKIIPEGKDGVMVRYGNGVNELVLTKEAANKARVKPNVPPTPVSLGRLSDVKPIVGYHGSDTPIEKFDLSKAGTNTDSGMFGKGIYFSGSKQEAGTYARKTGNVGEYDLNLKNPYVINSQSDIPNITANNTKEYSEKFTKYLQDKGYDGVIDNISPNKQFVVFNPDQIKPRVAQPPIGDINSKIDLERSINQNVQKIQKDFLDGKITIEQRKALAEKEFARSAAQPPVPPSTGGEITPQEIKKVSDNLQKYNQGLGRTDAEAMARDMIINRPFNKPSSGGEIGKGVTKGVQTPLQSKPLETTQPSTKALLNSEVPTTPKPVLQTAQIEGKGTGQNQQSLDSIISEGRKKIKTGGVKEDNKTFRQVVSDLYTQWVDRYNPIVKASQQAKQVLKTKGASLRPEYDPEYLVRRLTGAGGIADQRFQTELKPIIDQVDQLKINKLDLDTYLANKRIAGFGTAGRDIYGADPKKAQEIVSALETKYGEKIKGIAEKLYAYQDKGLSEMSDFISPEAMAAMKKQNPDYSPLYRAMDDASDYLGLPTRKTMQGSQPIQKIKGSTRQIESPLESIIGNTFTQRAAIEKNRVAKAIVGLQNVADLGYKKVGKSGNDTITVWNNGKKEYWQVGTEIADVAKGANEENMNIVLKVIQAPAALLRQGATGRNPEFMLPNIIRDQLDAGITSRYGYIPFVDYVSGLKSMISNDDVYKRWAQSGAKIDLGSMSGKKSIKAMFDEKTAKKGLFSWIGKGLDVLGKYSEQPTRVGLFKKAYQKTGNELLSAMESRDATVDFARMGSKMKVANSIIPFLNVGVQGFDKLIRAVKDNPGKVAVLAGIYGAAPQIASTVYNLQNFPQEYAEVPQYEKDSNFVFIKGRNERGNVDYVTIPKGNVLPVIANPIQSFLEYVYGVDGQSFSKMAMNVLSDALPVISPGGSAKEIAIKTIGSNIPQAVKPIAETLLNKSFYKYDPNKEQSKDIVPYFLQNRPAYKQAYEFTPQMYQKIGAVVNVSPLQVQNIMEGYLAGYSKIPAQIIDMMTKVSRGEDVETNDKTILRRFIKETYPSSAKPAPKPIQSPNLMERITGKASAAGPIDKPLEDWQIQDEKYKLKQSDKKYAEVGNTIFYKKSNGDIGQADISKTPEKPTLTGQAELDKKLLSSYYSDVTSQANDIVDLYEVGKLTAQEANTKLTELKALKSSGKSKKAPKVSMARIKMPKLKRLKSYKPKKIKIKKIKLPKIKLLKAQRV